ncbi:hypothetical protein Ahy_B05g078033 isoform B [Arachis hypogaea]|uniref:SWIM-type domain-containing protein n=1 Tax=Arachis hypogaea TaxID=3818 RepID=A0A444Z646_ARAHY|nr:hypothetical protein Ahy_B05g078033 isoform B [Arachis hypogaea]
MTINLVNEYARLQLEMLDNIVFGIDYSNKPSEMSISDFNLKRWLTGMLVFGCQQFLIESCNVEDADVHSMVRDMNEEHGCNEDFDDACDVGATDIVSDEDTSDYGNVIGLSDQQIMRKVFQSKEFAYEFYCKFGRCQGFGVRKGDYGKDDDGNLIRRRFFCNRAGLRDEKYLHRLDRQRGHRPETRTNCMAKLSIYLDRENSVWKVRKVILDHHHKLTPQVDKFEFQWDQAADEYGLHKNCWVMQMYEKRHIWASAYLRDKFCAGYRITSRCEGINSHVKKFLTSRYNIVDLVQNLELGVREYRNNELVAQFTSMYSTPVLTTCLDPIEKCPVAVYARVIFMQVKREIDVVGGLNFVSKRRFSTTMVYTTKEYGHPGQNVVTLFDNNSLKFECRCRFWEKEGFLCKHIFLVMKHEHLKDIPSRLILKR